MPVRKQLRSGVNPYLPNDSAYLREISELEECEVVPITDADHVAQIVPPWAEINLHLKRESRGQERNIFLRRSDGELIIECLREVLHPDSQGLLEKLWAEMDGQFEKLKAIGKTDPALAAQQGHCLGLAKAIAMVINPYDPDVDAVRAECVERWNQ